MVWDDLRKVLLPPGALPVDNPNAASAAAAAATKTAKTPKAAATTTTANTTTAEAAAGGKSTGKGKDKKPASGGTSAGGAAATTASGKKRRGGAAAAEADGAEEHQQPEEAEQEDGAAAAAAAAAPPKAANGKTPASSKRARKGDKATPTAATAATATTPAAAAPATSDAPTLSVDNDDNDNADKADADNEAAGPDGALAAIDGRVRARGLPGHLRRVKLRNFMCHANFEMEFGAHVNVVSGTNGSGKSAVLQAVQACLGASAKQTGRAASMGDFVRTGAGEALVSVELWNAGEDGYDRQRLGDSVTIERRIAAGSGASQWRVIDSRGRTVASGAAAKKRLIDPLLDHLSVNAANPMAAMTQDTARTFLSSGTTGPAKRYELFMEATMLALFRTNLDAARSYAAQMSARVADVLREHSARVGRRRDAERKLALLDEAAAVAANRGALERAAAWALAGEGQAEVRALRDRLEKGIGHEIKTLREGRKRATHELDGKNKEQTQLKDRVERATAMAKEFANKNERLAKRLKEAQQHVKEISDSVKERRHDFIEADKALKRARAFASEADAAQRAELEPQLASQQESRKGAEQRLAEARTAEQQKAGELKEARARLQQAEDDVRRAEER
jgi:hypothetical protein